MIKEEGLGKRVEIYIDTWECYPVYYIDKEPPGRKIEIHYEELKEIIDGINAWKKLQQKLEKLYEQGEYVDIEEED